MTLILFIVVMYAVAMLFCYLLDKRFSLVDSQAMAPILAVATPIASIVGASVNIF